MNQKRAGLSQDVYDDAQLLFHFNQMHHELRRCDVAIALGSHDIGVADVTAELFHRGFFPVIVFSGANTPTTQDRFPDGEAVHYRARAAELGVPAEAILLEPRATNTRENLQFSRQLLQDHGIHPDSAILTCRPYQQRRAHATCQQVWPRLDVVCASEARTFDDYMLRIGSASFVVNMIVGDTQRVIEYPKVGHAIEQHVPARVDAAFHRLVTAGFTRRQIPAVEETS